ncbi:winged helix DNA-binding protein [Muricauda sp. SCSIO 64092]|uniref:MarR family winged helix-turn-helix transcriptional regulator n=1 Tax=Allomuricauda sp. SCSIO 64092 TaxID=2908842 RepID=UPI001FF5381E|nr:winged helix DNA-binding protein [Muricauda sp. SCSIO 64092]UOY08564.1 winged helix DNA-binding protein [Muricauda sp. SCSIO 64092]
MDAYDLTRELVLLVGEFKKEDLGGHGDLVAFLEWLHARKDARTGANILSITGHSVEAELAAHLGRLNRYANTYIKMVLEGTPFTTAMEFTFSAVLDKNGEVAKTDLIRMMAFDKSTGMGVIKRLLNKGLIEEFPNPEDKRSKLLRLTQNGKKAVALGYQTVPGAANMISKNLEDDEKQELLHLLKKLDGFHYPIYLNGQERAYL